MSQEMLHDAIGRLDDDLVEAVDALRSGKKTVSWKRWLSAAACLCVLLAGVFAWSPWRAVTPDGTNPNGGAGQDGAGVHAGGADIITGGAVPGSDAQEMVDFQAQYIRTDGYRENAEYPAVTVIHSRQELESYYEANKDLYDLERRKEVYSDTSIGFLDACDQYDDAYFAQSELVLILLEEGSGSVRHQVSSVWRQDGLRITVERQVPEVGTCDMAQWHIFLEIPKGSDPSGAERIEVIFTE